jgi:hypothetical protein
MNWRTTAVLLLILLLLGGYLYYQNQQAPAPTPTPLPGEPTPARISLIGATIDEVGRLDITRHEDGTAVSYSRDEMGGWFLRTVPTVTVVLSQSMDLQTTGLLNLTSSRTLSADLNPLSAYGLDAPAYTIVLATNGANEQTPVYILHIGNRTPTGNEYYVQREGDARIHTVPQGPIQNLIMLVESPPIPPSS